MESSLKKVEGVFQCRVCVQVEVMEDVADSMNNEVERVDGFEYLRDKLNAGGGCPSTVTLRLRMK